MSDRTISWHYYALGTIGLWASAYVFTKVVLGSFSPVPLGFLRCAIASAALLTVLALKKELWPPRRAWPEFILSGAVGFAVYLILFNRGAGFLTATTSCIIISISPILTAFMGAALFRERLPGPAWAAMFLEFSGILILTLWNGWLSINQGVVWMLGAALAISAYNVIQKAYARRYSPLRITAYSFTTATVMLAFSLPQAGRELLAAPMSQVGLVVFLGLGPSAAAYLMWAKALSLADRAGAAANYMFLTPGLSFLLGYLVIGELPDLGTVVGGAVTLSGLVLFNFFTSRKKGVSAGQ